MCEYQLPELVRREEYPVSVFLPVPLVGMYACASCGAPARWQALTEDGYADVCADHLTYPVTESCQTANDAPMRRAVCDAYVSDGNRDDPTYAYCGLPHAHAGAHEYSF